MLWISNGMLATRNGHILDCDTCPCEPPPEPCCGCGDGIIGPVYIWGTYQLSNIMAAVGCVPTRCEQDYAVGTAFQAGLWNRTFRYGAAIPAVTGAINGCPGIRVTAGCSDRAYLTIGYNLGDGGGWFDTTFDSNPWPSYADGHCPDYGLICGLPLPHVVVLSTELRLYATLANPAFGIPVPDGVLARTDYTFSVTLTLGGIPTTYTANLRFSVGFSNVPFYSGPTSNMSWTGSFTECNGHCVPVTLDWDWVNPLDHTLGGHWQIRAYTVGEGFGSMLLYDAAPFPVAGNSAWATTIFGGPICNDVNPVPWTLA